MLLLALTISLAVGQFVITGIVDGPLTGGQPKTLELFATEDIADLSVYSLQLGSNGGAFSSTTTLDAVALSQGEYYHITHASAGAPMSFQTFFGQPANQYSAGALNVNGDDTVGLFLNSVLVDVFGVLGTSGTGEAWEYTNSWAYRNNETDASTTFDVNDWTFGGVDALDGSSTNAAAGASAFPIGTFYHTLVMNAE